MAICDGVIRRRTASEVMVRLKGEGGAASSKGFNPSSSNPCVCDADPCLQPSCRTAKGLHDPAIR
jgi:hypothetical protein